MRVRPSQNTDTPQLIGQAVRLADRIAHLSTDDLQKAMKISPKLAAQTWRIARDWSPQAKNATPAIQSFVGDIYSGLQVKSLSKADLQYAAKHLRIVSGLYGILRPNDGIHPYRLEMGYKLPGDPKSLYDFWGASIAQTLPDEPIVNLLAVEYSKAVLPYVTASVITPRFLTALPDGGEPDFVAVHAKIARGAFAHWMITNRIDSPRDLLHFTELGYSYDAHLSTVSEPVFTCRVFGGKGLSIRLES